MVTITPCLWMDGNAEEAVEFYASVFDDVEVLARSHYGAAAAEVSGMPQGSIMTLSFTLLGQEFVALNGGPQFPFNPSVSFTVHCSSRKELDGYWEALSDQVLMELDAYPWNERYGWCQDRFGVSWQFMLAPRDQTVVPSLLFVGDLVGRGKEAIERYVEVFDDATVLEVHEEDGTVKHAAFRIAGTDFILAESSLDHDFAFNESVSFIVQCDMQAEIDQYWDALTADGEEGQCGWLTDRFGVSWQVAPSGIDELLTGPSGEDVAKELFAMKRIDLPTLERAAR